MKNIALIITYMMIGTLTVGILLSLNAWENRRVEVEGNLSNIAETALKNGKKEIEQETYQEQEFLSKLVQDICGEVDTDSDIKISIAYADMEKGILSIALEEEFSYLNGKRKKVKGERTVLWEEKKEEKPTAYQVRFYLEKEQLEEGKTPYKSFTLQEGDSISKPKIPQKAGKQFGGWKDLNGKMLLADENLTENRDFYAIWN